MKQEFSPEEYEKAMRKIACGHVPSWMKPIEKEAFALGVITRDQIVNCPRCHGTGELPTSDNPYFLAACPICNNVGTMISDEGKALIKIQFPEYDMRTGS